jgi:excisionase family DNA binding protein
MSGPRELVFFCDRDLGRQFPTLLAEAGIQVERHDVHFGPTTSDADWLAEIGRRGWVAVTRDSRIRYSPLALSVLMQSGVRLFVLVGKLPTVEAAATFVKWRDAINATVGAESEVLSLPKSAGMGPCLVPKANLGPQGPTITPFRSAFSSPATLCSWTKPSHTGSHVTIRLQATGTKSKVVMGIFNPDAPEAAPASGVSAASPSLSLTEAAAFLHIHPDTCASLTRTGVIPGCKIGRAWVYHRDVLDEYLRERCRSTAAKVKVPTGYESRSQAARFANLRARRTKRLLRNSSSENASEPGAT